MTSASGKDSAHDLLAGQAAHEPHEPERGTIRIGISACLVGDQVRFDGGHKRDRFLTDTLADFVTFVPMCPEVDIGLGVPREAIRLVRRADTIRLVASRSDADHTRAMERYARRKARELRDLDLAGFIFKKDSPSCGLHRVRVYPEAGSPARDGRGIFARVITERLPHLPVEEEGRLNDPRLREAFIERMFAYRRVLELFRGRWTRGDVVAFHAREKLLLLAHAPAGYRALGGLVAAIKGTARAAFAADYQRSFMAAMAVPATTRKHTNTFQHMAGYFKRRLDADGRAELAALIDDYRRGLIPLIVPITLIRHHVRVLGVSYLDEQTYLSPHPMELMLRNHV